MCIALIGEMDRLVRNYISEAKRFGIDLKVYAKLETGIVSKARNVNTVVIFTNKVSHKAKREMLNTAKAKNILVFMYHSLNFGYAYNNYKLKVDKDTKRKGIWKASFATEVEVVKDLKLVADTGIERNEEKGKNIHPAFILGGLSYSISKGVDVNFGVKGGLNKPADDVAVLAGIALRF